MNGSPCAYSPSLLRLYTLAGQVVAVQRTYRAKGDKLRPSCEDVSRPGPLRIEASQSRQRAWQDERTTLSLAWDVVIPDVEGWTIRCIDRQLLAQFERQCRRRAKTPVCKPGQSPYSRGSANCTVCTFSGL